MDGLQLALEIFHLRGLLPQLLCHFRDLLLGILLLCVVGLLQAPQLGGLDLQLRGLRLSLLELGLELLHLAALPPDQLLVQEAPLPEVQREKPQARERQEHRQNQQQAPAAVLSPRGHFQVSFQVNGVPCLSRALALLLFHLPRARRRRFRHSRNVSFRRLRVRVRVRLRSAEGAANGCCTWAGTSGLWSCQEGLHLSPLGHETHSARPSGEAQAEENLWSRT
mmetsp:Transcript_74840/g.178673  ORF Transcript_74840/g.178673 Transcript_74840/m.178673 type:complete len:223 (+) Transcript_74840:693-1361(+)